MGLEVGLVGGLGWLVVVLIIILGGGGAEEGAYFILLDYPGENGCGVDILDLPWLGFWV